MKFQVNFWFVIPISVIVFFASSCLESEFEEKEKEEQSKIDEFLRNHSEISENDKLESGIYLKFLYDNEASDTLKPGTGNTVVLQYTGRYADASEIVFETTDPTLGNELFPSRYYVYGDIRLKMGELIYGFDTTLRHLSIGDSVIMVIPSKYMWYDYNPVAYNVLLKNIILSDTTYEQQMFNDFFVNNEFDRNNFLAINSSGDTLFYKITNSETLSETPITVKKADSLAIGLNCYYAESYYADGSGRLFYPLPKNPAYAYPEEFIYTFNGGSYFPIVPAIDSAIKNMALGDIVEICGLSSWGYGETGFSDQYSNIVAVPAYTPVHYRIELLGHKEGEVWQYAE
jgi:FKBP-type peptidyl-prolyl cis-trans isomerase